MDSFVLYLIVINIITFLVFFLDYLLCVWNPALDDTAANSLILDVFPLAGGALGMLIALFVLGGIGRKRRMHKDNIAWWFLAILCLVIWSLVVAVRFGFVVPDIGIAAIFTGWDLNRLKILGVYLAVVNVVTFIAFAWDKHVAANGNDYGRRAPEARLLGLCLIGGSIGGMLAMNIVRHKTKKWYFVWGLPVFLALDIALILFAHASGLF